MKAKRHTVHNAGLTWSVSPSHYVTTSARATDPIVTNQVAPSRCSWFSWVLVTQSLCHNECYGHWPNC